MAFTSLLAKVYQANAALHMSEQRHRLALLAGRLGSWELDPITSILSSSASCNANFGLPPDTEISTGRFLDLVIPEDRQTVKTAFCAALAEGADYDAEYRVRWPDGTVHWIAAFGRPFLGTDGTATLMLGTTQDITERKQGEEERERLLAAAEAAREQAERAVDLRDEFLSSAVHDLRTPLTSLQGRTQLMQRRISQGVSEKDKDYLAAGLVQVRAGIVQMGAILAELQDVAFLQIGHPLELAVASVDLVVLTQRLVTQLHPLSRRHTIRVHALPGELQVDIDASRIARVVTNLVTNAIKYSPDGGDVTVHLWRDEDKGVLAVMDEGVGIPASDIDRIFERFQRGSNIADTFAGTGIGLAGAKQIVEQHGGTISVESQEGKGSMFTVSLPASTDPVPPPT